jgi:dihydrofolate synthase/folylpolyglutamate synthase
MLTYDEALDYLYSFIDYGQSRPVRYSAQTFDLSRMVALMRALGNPQTRYPCLHVAGTKGKGSVVAMCASALKAGGYRTGLFTSPHLQDFRERIQIGGDYIPKEAVAEGVITLQKIAPALPGVTHWELVTALAFDFFARQNVDVAVIEVGLGGRLDMTNVITPLVSVITSISYDHTHLLGDTLTAIAGEKAGIIKRGVPVVSAPQHPEALAVIERTAQDTDARLTLIGRDWRFRPVSHSLGGQVFELWSQTDESPIPVELPLLGAHQIENAATAYAALQVAREHGLPLSSNAMAEGLKTVQWPGRFEILNQHPAVVADGAHNRDSAHRLAATVNAYFPGQRVILLFGSSSDKDIAGMLDELLPGVERVIVTQAVHPRASEPDELAELVHARGKPVEAIAPVARALESALQYAAPEDVILACGSLFVVAEIRAAWKERLLMVEG